MLTPYKQIIKDEFESCIAGTIQRLENEDTHRPFHSALLSSEALFWSRFERSFSTSFGQRVIEKISKVAALSGGASDAENQRATNITIDTAKLASIEDHIGNLRNRSLGRGPDWKKDLVEIHSRPLAGQDQNIRVISDLWWLKNGINHYMSIKTVKPNIDQAAEAKRDLLKLKINDPSCKVYFGLYYNPYGENRNDYAWTPPKGIFDFQHDEVVLIGREYWDTLGGLGFYDEVLEIANKCGTKTKKWISEINKN